MIKIEEYLHKFENGSISRRVFVKALMTLGLSVPLINGILVLWGSKRARVF